MSGSLTTAQALVAVVGSVNLDIVTDLDRLPRAGETLIATSVRRNVGGKGANQAVASAISGAATSFIGRVGDDADGQTLVTELARRGVATEHVAVVDGTSSGAAYIAVAGGANTIIVASGANGAWSELSDDELATVSQSRVVLSQLEIPDEVIAAAAAATTGRFVLNAAPARTVPDAVLTRCDPVIVNEHELAELTGATIDGPDSAITAAHRLREDGALSVVATLGAAGAIWVDADGSGRRGAPDVEVVDSTGAGDQFVGALVARLARGDQMAGAIEWGVAAASMSVQSNGTLDSYPSADAIGAVAHGVSG